MSKIQKRSVKIGNHATSIALENEFWQYLHEIAAARNTSIAKLIQLCDGKIAEDSHKTNFSSFVRVELLKMARGHDNIFS